MSPLADPMTLPLVPFRGADFGMTLVVAPHPDDEALGCGGLIALLRSQGYPVCVLVISDGTRSHPNSAKYPAVALRDLRERESIAGMSLLGVPSKDVIFLRLPDGEVPAANHPGFSEAVSRCAAVLKTFAPQTVCLPWRNDPHTDHRASWQIGRAALSGLRQQPRVLEYPIWDWDSSQRGDLNPTAYQIWRLDVARSIAAKQRAIAAYQSQTTTLIDDDPDGFCLPPEMLANFAQPWEVYLEEQD